MKYIIQVSQAKEPFVSFRDTNWGGDDLERVLATAKDVITSEVGLARNIRHIRVVEVIESFSRATP